VLVPSRSLRGSFGREGGGLGGVFWGPVGGEAWGGGGGGGGWGLWGRDG